MLFVHSEEPKKGDFILSLLVLPSQDGILGSNIIMIDEVISTLSIVIGVRVLWNMRAASNVMMDV